MNLRKYKPRYNENREYENNINKFRVEENLTLRQLSTIVGIQDTRLWSIAQGYESPFYLRSKDGKVKPWATSLCEYFGVSLSDLFPFEVCPVEKSSELLPSQIQEITTGKVNGTHKILEKKILTNVIKRILCMLQPREELILKMRFGIGTAGPKTYREIGYYFHVSRERIRQIEKRALNKLRHPTRKKEMLGFLNEHIQYI